MSLTRQRLERSGLLCSLDSSGLRERADSVLCQIADRCPNDYERVTGRLVGIRPIHGGYDDDAALAEWRVFSHPDPGRDAVLGWWWWNGLGELFVREQALEEHGWVATPVFAHEFGHIAARKVDYDRRHGSIDPVMSQAVIYDAEDEDACDWTSEAVANWHAYKWGFGRPVRRFMTRGLSLKWRAPLPGETIRLGSGRRKRVFRMTRAFYLEPVASTTPNRNSPDRV